MAQVGGISVAEMNKLEIELCVRLNWELHIVHDEYLQMVQSLFEPEHRVWKRWQHQQPHALPSDDATHEPREPTGAPPSATPHAAAPQPAVSRSVLPLWAAGFRRRTDAAASQAGTLRRAADGSHATTAPATTSGTSPVASVSVR